MSTPVPGGAPRTARIERRTAEVQVTVQLDLDGSGDGGSDTGVPFLDHMVAQLGRHARFDLRVEAKGDLEIDAHHTVEDTGIALGQALAEALGDKSGCAASATPSSPWTRPGPGRGRPVRPPVSGLGRRGRRRPGRARQLRPRQARHFLEAVVANARCTVHVQLEAGDLPHHCLEACFKALARALGDACAPDPRAGAGSTKGSSDDPPAGGRARLRGRESPLGCQGPGPGWSRGPGGAYGGGGRRGGRAARARGRGLRGLPDRPRLGRRRPRCRVAPGRPAPARHLRRHAAAVRGQRRGPGQRRRRRHRQDPPAHRRGRKAPRVASRTQSRSRTSAGTRSPSGPAAACLPASATGPASTSSTPTPPSPTARRSRPSATTAAASPPRSSTATCSAPSSTPRSRARPAWLLANFVAEVRAA